MENSKESQIIAAEALLCQAMLASDVQELDRLLSSELVFSNHLGQVLGKKDDLQAHQSGLLHLSHIAIEDQQIKLQQDTAIVVVKMSICGSYDGQPADGTFRFTRVWQHVEGDRWEVIAAHSSGVAGSS
ncbi:nuclear transport factor 2 family protein [Celerinatantimonas sp. YJH-8]|uniref:nuclear transport factor 2 family protein n=1 Tax=Celerinatantimonas sp. YJH-8 TaxID=3228714 RepID=UPI0038BFDC61